MRCSEVRDRLLAGGQAGDPGLSGHLAACADCARFAARRELVRQVLQDHHLAVEPGPDFGVRLRARIDPPADLISWAALRLLPAAFVMALLLGGLVRASAAPGDAEARPAAEEILAEEVSPADDVIAWVADPASYETGEGPGDGTGTAIGTEGNRR